MTLKNIQKSLSLVPVFRLLYQKLKGNNIMDTIEINGSDDLAKVTIRRLPDGIIQLYCPPKKSFYFKDSKERIILNLNSQLIKAIVAAMDETVEDDNNSKTCSISFRYIKDTGYSWFRNEETASHNYCGGGLYESLLGVLFDINFLKTLKADLGAGSVHPELMKIAKNREKEEKKNRIPFPDDVIDALEEQFGVKCKGRK